MKLIYVCSPLRGDAENNIKKARSYCRKVSECGYIPIAPHIIFTQFLDDNNEKERRKALKMGLALLEKCDEIWIFGDGISEGMRGEITHAECLGIPKHYMKGEK